MYRTWFAIGLAGLLGGVAVVSLFAGFGSPVFLVVAAVSGAGALLAYSYARERMLRSVYAGIGATGGGAARTTDEPTTGGAGGDEGATARASRGETGRKRGEGERAAQATDGGETTAGYDEWTWAGSDPDDPFWSDDPGDWEDPWEWEATDPEEAGADGWWETRERRETDTGDADGSRRRTGWTGDGREGRADESRGEKRRRGPTSRGEDGGRPSVVEAYRTLGLEPGADPETVREAYRERAKETHPDLGGDPEAFIRVREAYERLRERFGGEEQ